MLAQSNANSAAATTDLNTASAAPGKSSDSSSTADDTKSGDGTEATSTDPSAIAAALALLSQYMASPPVAAANAAAQPAAEVMQTGAAAAAVNGIAATAATAATSAGAAATSSATDAKDTQPATTTAQDLAALLVGDADDTKTSAAAKDPAQSDGSSSNGSSTTPDNSGNSAAAALNPQLAIASHFSAHPVPAHLSEVKSPVGSSAWADEVGGKVTWMAKQGIDSASLKLSPEHLGPVEVHISVQNGATSVMFGAAQADTRAALEQALPRLREMFAGQGLTLADAGVSREPPRQQGKPSPVAAVSGISAISEGSTTVASVMPVRLGLLDTYA